MIQKSETLFCGTKKLALSKQKHSKMAKYKTKQMLATMAVYFRNSSQIRKIKKTNRKHLDTRKNRTTTKQQTEQTNNQRSEKF